MASYSTNRFRSEIPTDTGIAVSAFRAAAPASVHRSLPEYRPTPLESLPGLARHLGVGRILVKDESHRFGLQAFKALGATYACYRWLQDYLAAHERSCPAPHRFYRTAPPLKGGEVTFCTATDGNHGRGVAWTARKIDQQAVIYMPAGTVTARIRNIQAEGAEVRIVDGTYDDAVRQCAQDAAGNNWQIISDTSWPGYEQIPAWIQAGYLTLFEEIETALDSDPRLDLVIVQGGVGALAAAAAYHFRVKAGRPKLKLITVEPVEAACLKESIETEAGEPILARGEQSSIMAGLNCGLPSPVAWPIIRSGYDGFLAIEDQAAIEAMRLYHSPQGSDPSIISGESGAAGLAGLLDLLQAPSLSEACRALRLGADSTVLLLNTEGATDPENYDRLVLNTNR